MKSYFLAIGLFVVVIVSISIGAGATGAKNLKAGYYKTAVAIEAATN